MNLSFVTDGVSDQSREFTDGNFVARTNVNRFRVAVALHKHDERIGEVVDMQQFAKLASEFSLDDPAVAKKKTTTEDDATVVPEEQVRLEKVSCRKQPIDKLLKEGSK